MKKTTACVAARGKNSDRTYLSGLLLEVLLPSLVALVATSHFIVFFEGDARKVSRICLFGLVVAACEVLTWNTP